MNVLKRGVFISGSEIKKQPPPKKQVWRMFDRIAPSYDLLNRLLSVRQDVRWRKKITKYLPPKDDLRILDLATGTADVLITITNHSEKIKSGTGIDMAEKMLDIGRKKILTEKLEHKLDLEKGDIMNIPFPDNTFDVITISFGIRNVEDVRTGLKEMYRTLIKSGRLIILEFSLPENKLIKQIYLLYFRKILPFMGYVISGDNYAYKYLNETVESFPYGEAFCDLIRETGFRNVRFDSLTFGIANIYTADK